jgi:hypothetical protein
MVATVRWSQFGCIGTIGIGQRSVRRRAPRSAQTRGSTGCPQSTAQPPPPPTPAEHTPYSYNAAYNKMPRNMQHHVESPPSASGRAARRSVAPPHPMCESARAQECALECSSLTANLLSIRTQQCGESDSPQCAERRRILWPPTHTAHQMQRATCMGIRDATQTVANKPRISALQAHVAQPSAHRAHAALLAIARADSCLRQSCPTLAHRATL